MLKLISLEWKKNNIGKYIRNAAITTAFLLLLILPAMSELKADETIELYGQSMIVSAVELFTHMAFMVFTSVMLSAFVVNAYENKTMHVMFSYPIKRQKILFSKMLAVWIFNFIAMIFSKYLLYTVLLLTKSFTHLPTGSIPIGEFSFHLGIFLSSAAMVSISYISLLVGLKMKSSKATIVTSIIIVCFTQGNIGAFSLVGSLPFYALLLILSFISVYLSIQNVETKDV